MHHCVQAVDPADPLMQQLVQDKSFLQAVQTSQLHAAATAAVRLLRVRRAPGPAQLYVVAPLSAVVLAPVLLLLPHSGCLGVNVRVPARLIARASSAPQAHLAATSSEFKRPPDRRASVPHANALPSDAPEPAPMPRPPGRPPGAAGAAGGGLVVHRQLVEPRHREAMRCMRLEVLGLEDVIPWDSVRRAWKTRVGGGLGGWVRSPPWTFSPGSVPAACTGSRMPLLCRSPCCSAPPGGDR